MPLAPRGPPEGPMQRARGDFLEWMGFRVALAAPGLLGPPAPQAQRALRGGPALVENRESQDLEA